MKGKYNMKNIYVFIFCLLTIEVVQINAAEIRSAKDGLWSEPATWVGGVVPSETDDVTLYHVVRVDANYSVMSLKVQGTSQVRYSSSGLSLTIGKDCSIESGAMYFDNTRLSVTVGGDLKINSTLDMGTSRANNSLTVKGNIIITKSTASFVSGSATANIYVYGDIKMLDLGSYSGNGNLCLCGVRKQLVEATNSGTLKTYNLTINNTSAYTQDHENDGIHVAAGINITVSNMLTMQNGIIYIADGNRLELTSSGSSSTGTLSASNVNSFVDGLLVRNVKNFKTFLFPVGHNGKTGYAFVKAAKNTTTRYGVRYFDSKPQKGAQPELNLSMTKSEMINAMLYATLSEEYWMVSNESNNAKAQLFEARVPEELKDTYGLDGEGGISKMYYCNMNNDVWSWTELPESAVNNEEGLYKGIGTGLVVSSKPNNNTDVFQIGNDDASKEWYFTYGIKKSYIESTVNNIFNNGQFDNPSSDYTWTGTVDDQWNESGNWFGKRVPDDNSDVVIDDKYSPGTIRIPEKNFSFEIIARVTQYPTVNTAQSAESVSINSTTASLTVTDGGSLIVNGALTVFDNSNPGHVIINQRYDHTSNLKYGSTNYDKFTVNRTFPAKVLYYVGSAVKGGGITSGFNSANGDYIANYIPSSESSQPQSSFLVDDYYGYNVGLMPTVGEPTERTITQVGDLKMDDTQFSLTLSNNKRDWEPDYGWDLISNPNPFAYPINKDAFDYNCDPVIWFRRFGGGQYYYSTISLESNVDVSPSSKTHPLRNEKFIAPNQAFFVKSTAAGQYFKFKSSYMTKDKMVTDAKLKSVDVERDVLRLTVESNNKDLADEMAFVFRDGGSMVSIRGDAEKRMEGSGYNQIYSLKDGSCYAIPFYPKASILSEEVLPLGVQLASGATEGVIRVRNMADFDKNVNVSLYDYKNNKIVDLREVGEYAFVAESGVKINDRFAIVLTALENEGVKGVETGVMDVLSGSIMISQDVDRSAVVTVSQDILSKNAEVNVYDMAGRLVKKQAISQVKTIVNLGDYKGVYVVEAVGEDVTKRAKLRVF